MCRRNSVVFLVIYNYKINYLVLIIGVLHEHIEA